MHIPFPPSPEPALLTRRLPQRHTVLLVEDEALISMMIEDMLTEAGYDVAVAHDGIAALQLAARLPQLSAVVTDLRLNPRMDGRMLIQALRASRPGLPALVVSAHAPIDGFGDLRGLGGPTARVGKPIDTPLMLRRLAHVISGIEAVT